MASSRVKEGDFTKIITARNAQRDTLPVVEDLKETETQGMITQVYRLNHIDANEVNKQLRILPSKDGEMVPYPPSNTLIMSDYRGNLERVGKILKELDQPGMGKRDRPMVVHLKNTDAQEVAQALNSVYGVYHKRGMDREGNTVVYQSRPLIQSIQSSNTLVIKAHTVA